MKRQFLGRTSDYPVSTAGGLMISQSVPWAGQLFYLYSVKTKQKLSPDTSYRASLDGTLYDTIYRGPISTMNKHLAAMARKTSF